MNANVLKWANKLNGREYGNEISRSEMLEVQNDNVIIVFGSSDDELEFRGLIYDEVSAYEGTEVKITDKLKIFSIEENRCSFEYNSEQIQRMKTISAVWCPKDKNGEIYTSWEIKTTIEHSIFNIYEDGELLCIGIVFDKEALLAR